MSECLPQLPMNPFPSECLFHIATVFFSLFPSFFLPSPFFLISFLYPQLPLKSAIKNRKASYKLILSKDD